MRQEAYGSRNLQRAAVNRAGTLMAGSLGALADERL